MAFLTNCTNKECRKIQEPYLDPKNDKVYCSKCDKEISNITHFTKIQMKSLKQFKQKVTASFSVKCLKCNKESRPKLLNKEVICGICNELLNNSLSPTFLNMLKEELKNIKDLQ